MARGHDINQARKAEVAGLGRELARRSKSSCELCGAKGVSLKVVEVPPLPEEPDPDRALMVCADCEASMEGGKLDPARWRMLESLVWSELPPVQVAAVRIAYRLRDQGATWAEGLIDGLYLDDEIQAWIDGER